MLCVDKNTGCVKIQGFSSGRVGAFQRIRKSYQTGLFLLREILQNNGKFLQLINNNIKYFNIGLV